jgi:hypothetical protein
MENLLNRQATITSKDAAGADKYGNTTYTLATAGPYKCRLEQIATTEMTQDRETVITRYRMFIMAGPELRAADTVQIDGKTYEVDGDPVVRDGMHTAHHIEATLKEIRP